MPNLETLDLSEAKVVASTKAFYDNYCTGEDDLSCYAFHDMDQLRKVRLPKDITYIGDHTFYNCDNLEDIEIPLMVETINDCAFQDCNYLSKIVLPENITRIDYFAFYNCNLESVILPPKIKYIGSYAFSKAIEYVQDIGIEDIARHEEELVEYIEERLAGLERVKIYAAGQKKAGAVSFNVYRADGGLIHPFDVGVLLDRQGVAVRTGHHCAEPLIEHLGVPGTLRASVGLYNTKEDIDKLIAALERAIMMLE